MHGGNSTRGMNPLRWGITCGREQYLIVYAVQGLGIHAIKLICILQKCMLKHALQSRSMLRQQQTLVNLMRFV